MIQYQSAQWRLLALASAHKYLIPAPSHKDIAVSCRRLHGWYVHSCSCPETHILIFVEFILIHRYTALGVMYTFSESIL